MSYKRNVPVFILAGGLGTRLSEETQLKPKPMLEIGEIPILVHIMRFYYSYGFDDFVICAGYRSWEIKNYFLNYEFRMNHLMIDHRSSPNTPPVSIGHDSQRETLQERWRVRVVDTGLDCMTGGRVARALDVIKDQDGGEFEHFALTYGDGLCDVDLLKEYEYHLSHGRIGTVLGVKALARFGELNIENGSRVAGFLEKPEDKQGLINGGFFFFKRDFRKYLDTDRWCVLERKPLEKLAGDSGLMSFPHMGFWHPMDTLRDKNYLQDLWNTGKAPWVRRR